MPNAAGAFSTVITSYKVPKQGTYRLVASYGKVKAEVSIDIGKSQPAQGYKIIAEKGRVCMEKSGTIDCAATQGPDGPGKDATFKISRAADSVKWTTYDASSKVIDSETAKK